MITLPENLTATKYNGYFWNVKTKKIYSLKTAGELRELKRKIPNRFNTRMSFNVSYFFTISNKGMRACLINTYLEKLKLKDSIIPTREELP